MLNEPSAVTESTENSKTRRSSATPRSRRLKLGMAAIASVALALSACSVAGSGTVSAGGGKKTIGVSMPEFQSLFYVAAVDGMKKAAADAGYDLVVLNANGNSSQQVNQVQNLVTQQVGAVIFAMQDATAGAAGVAEATSANIPVIAIDQRPKGEVATFIGSDSVKASEDLCAYLADQVGGKGNLAIIKGVLGSSTEIERSKGCGSVLAKHPDIQVVSTTNADWDENKAYNVAQDVLTANPDLQAIFAQNDGMALGAAKAAAQAGRNGIKIVSVDGFPQIYDAIEGGKVQATMSQEPYQMGQLAVKNAIQAMSGEAGSIPKEQLQPTVLVTKANLAEARSAGYYGPSK